jgi:hypothetical protein
VAVIQIDPSQFNPRGQPICLPSNSSKKNRFKSLKVFG